MTRPSDAPGVELARARAALRAASSAWDDALRQLGGDLDEAVAPLAPEAETEEAAAPETRESLLERREKQAEQMRETWPEGQRRHWWKR